MDILAKLLAPAALALWVLLALAFRARRDRQRRRFVLAVLASAAYFAVATPLGASPLLILLEHWHAPTGSCESVSPDALVIVLAGGMDADATSAEDASRLSEHSLRRVITAARIAFQVPSARFVLSGGGGGTVREADLMRRLMIDLGVDRDRLAVERESRNTWENALESAKLVDARDWRGRPVFLLTSAFHLPRAIATFRKAGLPACPIPADWRQPPLDPATAWIPGTSTLLASYFAWREVIALGAYLAAGRL